VRAQDSPISGSDGQEQGTSDPKHIAIIMDGNGRWAKARGLPRSAGHERGVEALRNTVRRAQQLSLKYLTVYSFSTENWRRPKSEVTTLFGLLKAYVRRDLGRLTREGVHIRIIGSHKGLPDDIQALIKEAEAKTAGNKDFVLCIAFNYGGREEISRAARRLATQVAAGELLPEEIEAHHVSACLDTADIPDPELIIRTSGEYRLSNFLPWQGAYSELVFLDVLWPDFQPQHLDEVIAIYHQRERRFGGLSEGAR